MLGERGAFVVGTIPVYPGEKLSVIVGESRKSAGTESFGGGATGGSFVICGNFIIKGEEDSPVAICNTKAVSYRVYGYTAPPINLMSDCTKPSRPGGIGYDCSGNPHCSGILNGSNGFVYIEWAAQ